MIPKTINSVLTKRYLCILLTSLIIFGLFSIDVINQSKDIRNRLTAALEIDKPFNASSLDLYHLSESEKEGFFQYRENIYEERRQRVSDYCRFLLKINKGRIGPSFKYRFETIVYDNKDKIAYCQIPKVASSTWCKHFSVLSRPSPQKLHEWRNAIQIFAPQAWPLPRNGQTLPELFEDLNVSLVVVRHPFARLASVYYEKFIYTGAKAWSHVSSYIIQKFRKKRSSFPIQLHITNPEVVPTPEEFLLYILESLISEGDLANPHWLPQYQSCPFCAVNFTVYSKMEEMYEDTAYVMLKANLIGKISPELKDNTSMEKGDGREANFWNSVSMLTIKKLSEYYLPDLDMFDYTVDNYFKDLNIDKRLN